VSVDILQEKIRKLKNPTMVEFCLSEGALPEDLIRESGSSAAACGKFCEMMLDSLKDLVPAVRFSLSAFLVMGPEGAEILGRVLKCAKKLGFYVAVDAPEVNTPKAAKVVAERLFRADSPYPCDGVILPSYGGSDIWKPFLQTCGEAKKDLFIIARTANKSASELQDLRCGNRLTHVVAADYVNRYSAERVGRFGYSDVGILAAASAEPSLKELRQKYPRLFLLMDGADYPNANAKKCAAGFDKFGHGAAAVVGDSLLLAGLREGNGSADYVAAAREAAERMKNNLNRYITIL